MKKSARRLTALAMAAAMGFGAFGMTGAEPAAKLFGGNAIVAEAAAAWYPGQYSFGVNVAANFTEMQNQNISPTAVAALKNSLTQSALTTGVYKNYRIAYSNVSGYNNVIVLYNPSKHASLNNAFGGSQSEKGKIWMYNYLAYINTLKQLSGVSKGHMIVVLDAYNGNSVIANSTLTNSNTVKLNTGASRGFEHGMTGSGNSSPVRFNWSTLHLTSKAYKNENNSIFITDDNVYSNLRLLCAVRALNRNGFNFSQILRDNSSSGSVTINGYKYDSLTAMQYAAKDIKSEYTLFTGYSSVSAIPSSQKLPFYRLGVLLKNALDVNVWNYSNSPAQLNTIQGSGYDAEWNHLYALCLSQSSTNTNATFMNTAKSEYLAYKATMTHTMQHNPNTNSNGTYQITYMTEPVMIEVCSRVPFYYTYYVCSRNLFDGLSSLDFLLHANDPDYDVRDITGEKMPGNNSINYWQFADKIVQ